MRVLAMAVTAVLAGCASVAPPEVDAAQDDWPLVILECVRRDNDRNLKATECDVVSVSPDTPELRAQAERAAANLADRPGPAAGLVAPGERFRVSFRLAPEAAAEEGAGAE